MLDRDAILGSQDLPRKEVEVEEWGGTVWVRGMNGSERDEIEGRFVAANNGGDLRGVRAKLVCMATVNEKGDRIFKQGDEKSLAEKSGAALDKLFSEILKLSGMADNALESAEKN